jgi:hypothetical protein
VGKVLWHTMMSLGGFIAGPNDGMSWAFGMDSRSGELSRIAALLGLAAFGLVIATSYSTALIAKLSQTRPSSSARAAVDDAKTNPLADPDLAGLPREAQRLIRTAVTDALTTGLQIGVGTGAGVVLATPLGAGRCSRSAPHDPRASPSPVRHPRTPNRAARSLAVTPANARKPPRNDGAPDSRHHRPAVASQASRQPLNAETSPPRCLERR